MWVIIVGLIFLAITVFQVVNQEYTQATVSLALSLTSFCIFFYFRNETKHSEDFIEWLHKSRETLGGCPLRYDDNEVSIDSRLVKYQTCFSFVIMSGKFESRYYIKGQHSAVAVAGTYTLVTLLLGWWGLPWGPIFTIQALASNLRGGESITVRELLESKRPNTTDPHSKTTGLNEGL